MIFFTWLGSFACTRTMAINNLIARLEVRDSCIYGYVADDWRYLHHSEQFFYFNILVKIDN